jgi:hypothetical protein
MKRRPPPPKTVPAPTDENLTYTITKTPLLQWQAAHQQLEDCIVVCMPMPLREACVKHTMALDQHLHWQQLHQQHSLMNLRLQVAAWRVRVFLRSRHGKHHWYAGGQCLVLASGSNQILLKSRYKTLVESKQHYNFTFQFLFQLLCISVWPSK